MIFLLHSDYFSGKSNPSRDALALDEDSIRKIKRIFRNKVSELIIKAIPKISEHNQKIDSELNEKYPHLQGYFEKETIGFIEKDNAVEIAQKEFLKDQKEILDASSLDDIKYEKYLEVSSRLLAEYILYRNLIINKLKNFDYQNDEEEIHNLIAPKGKTFHESEFIDTIFSSNAWLLDDKYMSYTTILSNKTIKEIYKELDIDEEPAKKDRKHDITIIFSGNPDENPKVDIVIVELKRLGLKLGGKEYLLSQLRQRARVLVSHYPDKIQRIWFYGIVDIDPEFRRSLLEDDYIELYSSGSLYYKDEKRGIYRSKHIMNPLNPPSGYCWRISKKKLQEMIADNRIWFGPKGNSGTSALKWGKGYRRRAGRHIQSRWLEWRWESGVSSNGDLRRGDKTDIREP
jgi:hypothetical protein